MVWGSKMKWNTIIKEKVDAELESEMEMELQRKSIYNNNVVECMVSLAK